MPGKWIEEDELNKLQRDKASDILAPEQRKSIEAVDQRLVLKGCKPATRTRYASRAKQLAKFLGKPFEEAAREDLAAFLALLVADHSPNTMRHEKSWLRRFYTLLLRPYDEKVPKLVSWIKIDRKRPGGGKPKPIFKPDEVKRILEATSSLVGRAALAVLYESGARVSELCGTSVGDVEFDQYGARLHVDGKTGPRKIRLVQSVPDLRDWLNHHPYRRNKEAPLFLGSPDKPGSSPLMPREVRNILIKSARIAGIDKRPNPHAFRRSRATELSQDLTPSELAVYHGWVQGSRMPQIYIHLSGDDVERKILQRAGVVREEERPNPLEQRVCPRCRTTNSATASHCATCTFVLDTDLRSEMEKEERLLRDNLPEIVEMLQDPNVRALLRKRRVGGASLRPNARRATTA